MSIMSNLVQSISEGQIDFNADLPYPNIYWCTVKHAEFGEFNTYLAGEFTGSAKAKVSRWCREQHGFMPYRSNSNLLMRRLRLGDIVQNPEAFDVARKHAVEAGERDIVAALDVWPEFIAQKVGGVALDVAASATLWERMVGEMSKTFKSGSLGG